MDKHAHQMNKHLAEKRIVNLLGMHGALAILLQANKDVISIRHRTLLDMTPFPQHHRQRNVHHQKLVIAESIVSLVGNNGRVAINRQVSSFVFIFIHSSFNLASENIHFQQTQTERCFTNFFF